jgi:hypothetical protein
VIEATTTAAAMRRWSPFWSCEGSIDDSGGSYEILMGYRSQHVNQNVYLAHL